MPIIQISKIQQRSGNLVDLPQLDNAQFGWAYDAKKLFIGAPDPENVEVITSYSTIAFSQIEGSGGANYFLSNLSTGQPLTFNSTNNSIVNYDGNLINGNIKLNLGPASNLSIGGGSIGYILETDGTGNLSWTPKGIIQTNIYSLSSTDPIVMTVANSTPYTNGAAITITGVQGANANVIVNSQVFYVKVANDFNTSGNVSLYTDSGLVTGADGTNLVATPNTGIATYSLGGTGGGTSIAAGSNTNIQYNNSGVLGASSKLSFDYVAGNLNVVGNINSNTLTTTGNITANTLISTIATGAPPLVVNSQTVVANLNASLATTVTSNAQPNITSVGTLGNLVVSSNISAGNINVTEAISSNTVTANTISGLITTSSQPNITSLGTLTSLTVTGDTTSGNFNTSGNVSASSVISTITTGTPPFVVNSTTRVTGLNVDRANISDYTSVTNRNTGVYYFALAASNTTGNYALASNSFIYANIANGAIVANTFVGNIQGNISGNITVNGANTQVLFNDNGNANATSAFTFNKVSNVVTITGNLSVSNNVTATTLTGTLTTGFQPNITSVGTLSVLTVSGTASVGNMFSSGYVSGSNVYANSGTVSAVNLTGTLTTNAQPNITSVGTLSSLNVSGALSASTVAGTLTTNAQPNITSVGTLTGLNVNGTVTAVNITANTGAITTTNLTTGANTTAGTITGNWTLTAGSKLTATYADLAEYYESDYIYEPGTVLEFGGDKEVTLATDNTFRVAGVVSSNPAYAMNGNCPGIALPIALQGRVPTKVTGKVNKGDLMVSAGSGYARAYNNPLPGTVIGKALQDFDGYEGIIEVVVGRL